MRPIPVAERLHVDAVIARFRGPASIPVTAAGVSSGTEQRHPSTGQPTRRPLVGSADRWTSPAAPSRSPTVPEGRAVLDRGVRLRRVVRGPRGTGDGPRRSDRDVGDDVRRVGPVRRGLDPGRRRDRRAAVVAAILLNLRYGPIGVSVAPALAGPWWSRLLRAQLVVDETWALSADGRGGRREDHRRRRRRALCGLGRRHGRRRAVR